MRVVPGICLLCGESSEIPRVTPRVYAVMLAHPLRQPLKIRVAQPDLGQMFSGVVKIFVVRTAPANRMGDDLGLFLQRHPAAILYVVGIDHIGDGIDDVSVFQMHIQHTLDIGRGNQLALAQLVQGAVFVARVSTARAKPVQFAFTCSSSASTRPGFSSVPRWWIELMQKDRE